MVGRVIHNLNLTKRHALANTLCQCLGDAGVKDPSGTLGAIYRTGGLSAML